MNTPPFLTTASGRSVSLLDPKPEDIDPSDIARGLAYTCRFGGHIQRRYASVAEHSVRVAHILLVQGLPMQVVQAGLLHDAAEAYIGDLVGPAKSALRMITEAVILGVPVDFVGIGAVPSAFDALESKFHRVIGERFGLGNALCELDPRVKAADERAFFVEERHQRGAGPAAADWCDHVYDLMPEDAEDAFLCALHRFGLAELSRPVRSTLPLPPGVDR